MADFGDSNVLDESDIGIETGDDIQNEERSESRVSEVSVASVTLKEYLNKDKNPESDYDISIHSDSDVSEYIPTENEIKMAEKELKMESSDNKKKSKPKIKSKKRKNNFNDSFTVELQSPKRIKSPVSHSTPKREKLSSFNDSFTVELQSPKRMKSPDSHSTPKREKLSTMPKPHSSSTFESPNSASPTFGSPKSHGSRKDPKSIDLEGQMEPIALLLENVSTFIYNKMTKDTVFKNYSPAILTDTYYQLPGLDKICIQPHSNTREKRKFDKEHICYYCGSCIIKMGRHLVT